MSAELKRAAEWHKQRLSVDGRMLQVACLTNSEGSEWIHYLDDLPSAVRRRLRESAYNVCPACLSIATHEATHQSTPAVADYLRVLDAIEQQLKQAAAANE
jgi:hypothetical protein